MPERVYLCTPPVHFGRRPPQPNYQPYTVFAFRGVSTTLKKQEIFQSRLGTCRNKTIKGYFLFYVLYRVMQCIDTVKVHRVFPSCHSISASSRKVQIHWISAGDSGEVVRPFMQVGTYPTRDFATLEPSKYSCRLLEIGKAALTTFFTFPVPGRSQTLYIIFQFCRTLCFY
jgi:hypothetical protein